MTRFDRLILGTVVALALGIAGLSVAMARLGPAVDTFTVARNLDGVDVNTEIAVTFTAPMSIPSVEHAFRVSPAVKGSFSWTGNQMVFLPAKPLAYSTIYSVSIGAGASSTQGHVLQHSYRTTFTTQSEHLMYLGTSGREKNRLVLVSLSGKREIVGSNDGLITGYAVSPDHSLVVYIKRGSPSERPDELWLLSLADDSTQMVYRRPDWTIEQPQLSPDDHTVAFLALNVRICRQYYGCYRDATAPLIYFHDLRARRTYPFTSTSDAPITDFIRFSPSGQVAYTDLGSALTLANANGTQVVHIPNQNNALEFSGFDSAGDKASFVGQTPTSTGGDVLVYVHSRYLDVSRGVYDSSTPAFSTDGKSIVFAAYHGERGIQPLYGLEVYSFRTGRRRLLTSAKDWTDWAPQWSTDDRYIAFIRSRPAEAMYLGSGEIWIMHADGHGAVPLGGIGTHITWVG